MKPKLQSICCHLSATENSGSNCHAYKENEKCELFSQYRVRWSSQRVSFWKCNVNLRHENAELQRNVQYDILMLQNICDYRVSLNVQWAINWLHVCLTLLLQLISCCQQLLCLFCNCHTLALNFVRMELQTGTLISHQV